MSEFIKIASNGQWTLEKSDDGYNAGIRGLIRHAGFKKLKDGSTNHEYDHCAHEPGHKPLGWGGTVTVDKHNVITDVGHSSSVPGDTEAVLRAHKAKFPHHLDANDPKTVKN